MRDEIRASVLGVGMAVGVVGNEETRGNGMKKDIGIWFKRLFSCRHRHLGWPINSMVRCMDCLEQIPVNWHEPSGRIEHAAKVVKLPTGIERMNAEEILELERLAGLS